MNEAAITLINRDLRNLTVNATERVFVDFNRQADPAMTNIGPVPVCPRANGRL